MRKTTLETILSAGVFALPLVCWAGLEHPFSTPKLWWIAGLDLAVAAAFLLRRPRPALAIEWPWLAWFASLALSAILAPYVSLAALLAAVLPVPLWLAADRRLVSADRLVSALLAGSAALSAVAVLQFCGLDPIRLMGWRPEVFASPRMRVYGTMGNPDFVAAWTCATLPLWIARAAKRKSAATLAGVILQCSAILATGSRVFLVAAPAAALATVLCRARFSRWWLAALPFAAVLLWLSPGRPLATTVQGRLYLARVAASHWNDIPVFGFGPGSFPARFGQWQLEWLRGPGAAGAARFAGDVDHAHNDYLEILVEYGPAGLFTLAALCGWLLWRARRTRSSGCHSGVPAGIAALLAIAVVDFPFHRPAAWALYWLLLGLLADEAVAKQSHLARKDC